MFDVTMRSHPNVRTQGYKLTHARNQILQDGMAQGGITFPRFSPKGG